MKKLLFLPALALLFLLAVSGGAKAEQGHYRGKNYYYSNPYYNYHGGHRDYNYYGRRNYYGHGQSRRDLKYRHNHLHNDLDALHYRGHLQNPYLYFDPYTHYQFHGYLNNLHRGGHHEFNRGYHQGHNYIYDNYGYYYGW